MNEQEVGLMVLLSTLIILLFVAGILIVVIRGRHQKTKQQVELAEMQITYQAEVFNAQTEIAEQLMSNMAREMHDNVGQMLTYLYLQIENRKDERPELRESLQPLTATVELITEQLRLLSHSLNTDHVSQQGLVSAITAEVGRLKKLKQLRVHYDSDVTDIPLNKDQQLIAFRIFQELINNSLRHSSASDIYISLQGGKEFVLNVRDNGNGFYMPDVIAGAKGSGLSNISKRAAMAGLMFDIKAADGQGCNSVLSTV